MKKLTGFILSLFITLVLCLPSHALNKVQLSPEYFPNPISSKALSNADIYVGEVDLDPEILANRKQVSVLQENGTIVAVSQPIKTGLGGTPVYNGSPVTMLVDGSYSLKVVNSYGAQVYYVPSSSANDQLDSVENVAALRALGYTPTDGAIAVLLGHTTDNDGGGGTFYYDASSVLADNNGTVILPTGHVGAGRWIRQLNGFVTLEMFGGGIQAAINACYINQYKEIRLSDKTYSVTDNIYLYGDISIIGTGKNSKLTLSSVPTYASWIICGISQYNTVTAKTWTGRIENVNFEIQAGPIEFIIHVINANGCSIDQCSFDANDNVTVRIIGGYNNGAYYSGSGLRKNIWIKNNTLNMDDTLSENIGFGYPAQNLWIVDNNILGNTVDDLGIHNCDNVTIRGNQYESFQGRIYISDSRNVLVDGNTIKYGAKVGIPGMGIRVECESNAIPHINENIKIVNNTITYGGNCNDTSYGIWVQGVRDCLISGNTLKDDSGNANGRIEVDDQVKAGWVDPTGVDPNDNPQSRDVRIIGNHVRNAKIRVLENTTNAIVSDNMAYDYEIDESATLFRNNIKIDATDPISLTNDINSSEFLFVGTAENAAGTYLPCKFTAVGGSKWVTKRNVRPVRIDVSLATALTSGYYQLDIRKNGVSVGTLTFSEVSDIGSKVFNTSDASGTYDLVPGDYLEVYVKTNNGLPTPNTVTCRVYGVYF